LREERWLRVFENRVLRRIFGAKRDEITLEWRKLNIIYICIVDYFKNRIRNSSVSFHQAILHFIWPIKDEA